MTIRKLKVTTNDGKDGLNIDLRFEECFWDVVSFDHVDGDGRGGSGNEGHGGSNNDL